MRSRHGTRSRPFRGRHFDVTSSSSRDPRSASRSWPSFFFQPGPLRPRFSLQPPERPPGPDRFPYLQQQLLPVQDLNRYTPETGFVLFGQRQVGNANTIAALTFSALLAAYAASIWAEKRLALQLGMAYALYVLANLVLWNFRKPEESDAPLIFALPYMVSAIGVSSGAAVLLWRHRERLR